MTNEYLTNFIENLNEITEAIDKNSLITNTREAVKDGIGSFAITEEAKAKLYANFEMQFSIQAITKLIDSVMAGTLQEQQVKVEEAKANLLVQQLKTEIQNTAKITAEIALLGSNKTLVDAQVVTEGKRKLDVMAGIAAKNEQMIASRMSAKFEESRRFTLINSTNYNNIIQKAKVKNEMLNSIALDTGVTISAEQMNDVKEACDAIPTDPIEYETELKSEIITIDPNE